IRRIRSSLDSDSRFSERPSLRAVGLRQEKMSAAGRSPSSALSCASVKGSLKYSRSTSGTPARETASLAVRQVLQVRFQKNVGPLSDKAVPPFHGSTRQAPPGGSRSVRVMVGVPVVVPLAARVLGRARFQLRL